MPSLAVQALIAACLSLAAVAYASEPAVPAPTSAAPTGAPERRLHPLSWLFVLSRIVHAYIHVTSNRVPRRFFAFIFGVAVLAIMWVYFAVQILAGI